MKTSLYIKLSIAGGCQVRPLIDYAISDIHGRYDLMMSLVGACIDDAGKRHCEPRFNFLGDIIDRGPRSRQCLDAVKSVLEEYRGSVAVMGNHERYALEVLGEDSPSDIALERWARAGGAATLSSYSQDIEIAFDILKQVRTDHVALMAGMVPFQRRGRFLLVHAGIDPLKPLDEQTVEDLTAIRSRFIDHVGYLDCVVIHGHTTVGDIPVVTENRVSIDTAAHRSGRLTACVIEGDNLRFLQTDGCDRRVVEVGSVEYDRGLGTCIQTSYAMAA